MPAFYEICGLDRFQSEAAKIGPMNFMMWQERLTPLAGVHVPAWRAFREALALDPGAAFEGAAEGDGSKRSDQGLRARPGSA